MHVHTGRGKDAPHHRCRQSLVRPKHPLRYARQQNQTQESGSEIGNRKSENHQDVQGQSLPSLAVQYLRRRVSFARRAHQQGGQVISCEAEVDQPPRAPERVPQRGDALPFQAQALDLHEAPAGAPNHLYIFSRRREQQEGEEKKSARAAQVARAYRAQHGCARRAPCDPSRSGLLASPAHKHLGTCTL